MGFTRQRRRGGIGASFIDIGPQRRADILTIIEAGWRHAATRGEVDAAMPEVDLNARLRASMVAAVNARVVRSYRKISVLPGTEARSDSGVPAGFTDIAIHLRDVRDRQRDHGPHAVIECKRVTGNDATLCRRYVVDGIDDRFIGAKYAGGHRTAFMAGYVLSGSIEAAAAGINRYLANRRRAAERLADCTALPASWARSSRHPRPSSEPPLIDLLHAFLTFPAGGQTAAPRC